MMRLFKRASKVEAKVDLDALYREIVEEHAPPKGPPLFVIERETEDGLLYMSNLGFWYPEGNKHIFTARTYEFARRMREAFASGDETSRIVERAPR